jgi:TusA-related sulfurtransferase
MIKPMTLTELKKELKKLEQSELIELISSLYKTNDKVKEILNVQFVGEEYQA